MKTITLLFAIMCCCSQLLWAQHEEFRDIPLNRITPEGWQKNFLIKQHDGLTGHLDTICEPFNKGGWIASKADWKPPFYKRKDKKGNEVLCWEPFEQTGYYYDGVIRCGLLLHDAGLIEKAKKQIYGSIADAAQHGGVIGSWIPDRWPQVTFFRAWMAAYEATGDRAILDALEKHYDNDKFSLAGCRSIINIEELVWLYQQTGEKKYLNRSVALYEAQASRGDRLVNKFDDLKSPERQDIHGCTFEETLKLPIILYMATGETKYLDAARNGYHKLEKFHMLPCGVPSAEEGLSGRDALSCYETCDNSDYAWTASYILKATGEVEWADKIERDILNAALGSVTKEFDAHQYFSSLNQVICQIGSSQSLIENHACIAYCQRQMPWCCTGNVNRFFPIYMGCQWLKGKGDTLVKALYGPSSVEHEVGGKTVKLREDSTFPFGDTIKIIVEAGRATFPIQFRVPTWAKNPAIEVNGVSQQGVTSGKFFILNGEHKAGNVITLHFPKEPRVEEFEMNGAVVDYGPLLFALPIASHVEKVLLNKVLWSNSPKDSKDLYGYNMTPTSEWRYVLALDKNRNNRIEVVDNPKADLDNPWNPQNPPIALKMFGLKMPRWEPHYQAYKPFCNKASTEMMPITPPLPPRGMMIMVNSICGKPERLTLVPYGSTTLRVSVFPYWDLNNIPSFRENQLDYTK